MLEDFTLAAAHDAQVSLPATPHQSKSLYGGREILLLHLRVNSHNSDTFCTFWPSSNLRRGGFAPYYLWHPKRSLTLPLPSIVSLFRMAVRVPPGQKTANTALRQRNARIGRTIVPIDGIASGCHGIAARNNHVRNVS